MPVLAEGGKIEYYVSMTTLLKVNIANFPFLVPFRFVIVITIAFAQDSFT